MVIDPLVIFSIILTGVAFWWLSSHDYSGDYNFTAVYTFPITIAAIAIIWMIYFAMKAFGL